MNMWLWLFFFYYYYYLFLYSFNYKYISSIVLHGCSVTIFSPKGFSLLTHTLLIFIIKYPSFYISSTSLFIYLFIYLFRVFFFSLEDHTYFDFLFFPFGLFFCLEDCTNFDNTTKPQSLCELHSGMPLVLVWHKLEKNAINI